MDLLNLKSTKVKQRSHLPSPWAIEEGSPVLVKLIKSWLLVLAKGKDVTKLTMRQVEIKQMSKKLNSKDVDM